MCLLLIGPTLFCGTKKVFEVLEALDGDDRCNGKKAESGGPKNNHPEKRAFVHNDSSGLSLIGRQVF